MKIRKIASLFLTFVLFVSVFSTSVHASTLDSASFWAQAGIAEALKKGFVPTRIQSEYTANITRREFANLALQYYEYVTGKTYTDVLYENGYEVMGMSPGKPAYSVFDDIMGDSQVVAAYALGIIGGTTAPTSDKPGKFSPDALLTREQAAVMVRNLLKALGADITNTANAGFTDISGASSWAVDSINYIRNAGVMGGTSTVPLMFSPKNNYTREQSIITFNNIDIEVLLKQGLSEVSTAEISLFGVGNGFTPEQVALVWGEHTRIIPVSIADTSLGEWRIYRNEDYTKFMMAGFREGHLVTIYTNRTKEINYDTLSQRGLVQRYADPWDNQATREYLRTLEGTIKKSEDPYESVYAVTFTPYTHTGELVTLRFPTDLESVEIMVFELINAFRGYHVYNVPRQGEELRNLYPYTWDDRLVLAARGHANDLNKNDLFGHTGSDGSSVKDRVFALGYGQTQFRTFVSESVHGGNSNAVITVKNWVDSYAHRGTLLYSGGIFDAGVGAVDRDYVITVDGTLRVTGYRVLNVGQDK